MASSGGGGDALEKEERIQQRRERIEERVLKGSHDAEQKESPLQELSKLNDKEKSACGDEQVEDSLARLDQLKARGSSRLTLIRLEADQQENQRRISEEKKRHVRLQELQREALESGKQNASIELRWVEVMQQRFPEELKTAMEEQQQSCEKTMRSKDGLIAAFREELKVKDEEYIKAVKQQREEVDALLEGMEQQYMELQKQFCEELNAVENAFSKEREDMVSRNQMELDSLFEDRRKMELHFMESKMEREEAYADELEKLRTQDAEEYNQLKIKLEMDIQKLEQQLEEMRATYQLNTEKLEYNYRVLTERDMENSTTLSQQKRKLARLKEALSTLTTKYNESDVKYKQENSELTEEYRRITKQYKDLQLKFKHFEVSDNNRYREMWRMHEEEVSALVKHLLNANQVLQKSFLKLPNAKRGMREEDFSSHSYFSGLQRQQESFRIESKEEEEKKEEVSEGKEDGDYVGKGKVSSAKIKVMLEMLCSEAGFLMDESLRKKLDMLDGEEAVMLRAESILRALGIENEHDIHQLLPFFFEKADEDEEDLFALELAKTPAEALKSLGLKITRNDVIKVVRAFMETKQKEHKSKHNPGLQAPNAQPGDEPADDELSEEDRYWKFLQEQVVPKETHETWKALHRAMQDYNRLLSSRSELVDQVARLDQENLELKRKFHRQLEAEDTTALLLPPTRYLQRRTGTS